jgi:DnaJ-class molecular chaperone
MEAMIVTTILKSCSKCDGTGVFISLHSHGVCFNCNGAGQITVKVSNTKPRQLKHNQLVIYKGQKGQVLSWSESFHYGSWSQAVYVVFFPDGKNITFDIESAQELEIVSDQSSLKETINQ